MKVFYIGIFVLLFTLLIFTDYPILQADQQIAILVFQETGVPNVVSGILLHNRLFDTVCEVMVFTVAAMTTGILLSQHTPPNKMYYIHDEISLILFRLGTTIAALICLELALRGHLSPGGGFAAGVAGGTAMGLITISSDPQKIRSLFDKKHLKAWEKVSVFLFVGCAFLTLLNVPLPGLFPEAELSSSMIPVFNILITIKVAIGAWAIILAFIRYRGLF